MLNLPPSSFATAMFEIFVVTLPLYLPPLDKGGRISYIREASPLFDSPYLSP